MTTIGVSNNTLQKVGHKHEAIMLHLLAYPHAKLGDVAAHFHMAPTSLSVIIHSSAFQDSWSEMRDRYYGVVAQDTSTKLHAIADIALEKLQDKIETSNDSAFILSTADKILSKLGFGSKAPSVKINNNAGGEVTVNLSSASPEALRRAELSRAQARLQAYKTFQGTVLGVEDAST